MISVIVPVYQTECYLSRCIDSILAQSFRDFELLLIDDGSKDASGMICDRYAQQDSRIRVFHKENSGVSDTRNFGLNHARGDYVAFVDSDDYIGQDYLKILIEMAIENDADIAIISFRSVNCEEALFVESTDRRVVFSGRELLCEMVKGEMIGAYLWSMLFKSELFRSVRFPSRKICEDLAVIPYMLKDSQNYVFSSSIQYYYYQRADSIVHSMNLEIIQDLLKEFERLLTYTEKNYPELYPYAFSHMAKAVFWGGVDWLLLSSNYFNFATVYRNKLKTYLNHATFLPGLTVKEKIKLFIFLHNVRLYRIVRILWIRFSRNPDNKRFLQE